MDRLDFLAKAASWRAQFVWGNKEISEKEANLEAYNCIRSLFLDLACEVEPSGCCGTEDISWSASRMVFYLGYSSTLAVYQMP